MSDQEMLEHRRHAEHVGYVVDTTLNAYDPDDESLAFNLRGVRDSDTLVVFSAGFEPMVVAVRDAYGCGPVEAGEAEELAVDYLEEIDWFGPNADHEPERIIIGRKSVDLDEALDVRSAPASPQPG